MSGYPPRLTQAGIAALRDLLAVDSPSHHNGSAVESPSPLLERVHQLERLVAALLTREQPATPRKPLSAAGIEQRRRAARFRPRDPFNGRYL
jgi:hypothetical protein